MPPTDRYPTVRKFMCRQCNQPLGIRCKEGLKVDKIILPPRQSFTCTICKLNYKSVSLAFAMEDAREKGLAAITATAPRETEVKPPAVDWELLKAMHAEGSMVIVKHEGGLWFQAVGPNKAVHQASDAIVKDVLQNKGLTVEEKRNMLMQGLAILGPADANGYVPTNGADIEVTEKVEVVNTAAPEIAMANTAQTEFSDPPIETPREEVTDKPADPAPAVAMEEESPQPRQPSLSEMRNADLPEMVRPMPPDDEDPVAQAAKGSKKKNR